jgi:uncharacterized repeat protein (TIGR01451 family)
MKEAVVILIAVTFFMSTVAATVNTRNDQTGNPELFNVNEGSGVGARGDIVWDNGMTYDGLLASQFDATSGLDAYPADDFHFDEDTEVCDVHWIGGYYNPDQAANYDWCIEFYADRGDGNAPGNLYAGPYCYTWTEITTTELELGRYEMSVDLPENILFPACYKFWIVIYALGPIPPQAGWGYHFDPVQLHMAVFKSVYFGFPDWVDIALLGIDPADMAFQLTTKPECEPSIDVEKYVKNTDTGEWVDADTQNEALEIYIDNETTFKIVIHNDGDVPLWNIIVKDQMHDSLEFINADPEPDHYEYVPPFYIMEWFFPGPLMPCDVIEIYIVAKVVGEDCSFDYNYVLVEGIAECDPTNPVRDEDYAYVHCRKKSREFTSPILEFIQNHPNVLPMLKLMIKLLKL